MTPSLQEKMAAFGFESNDDYEYPVRCMLESRFEGIRCLSIEGESERRKTAFATALAEALEFQRVLYHDFSERKPPTPDIILPPATDELGREEPPIASLDQRFSEACAYSEAEDTILILDQLHEADFREHIRLYKFVTNGEWTFRGNQNFANPKHMVLFLISNQPLYHSLQKNSFRVWVSTVSHRLVPYRPEEFGLTDDVLPVMEALGEVFRALQMSPTKTEYAHILDDVHWRVRTRDHLRHSIYGWTEGVDRAALFSDGFEPLLGHTVDAILDYLSGDHVELTAPE